MIERLAASEYAANPHHTYEDVSDLHSLYEKIAFRSNVVLVGPKGIGKTLSVAAFAALKKVPIVTFDCSEDVRRGHLYGTFTLKGNESPFVLGPVPTAIEVANEVGNCILCLEEVNALNPQSQKLLNPITDFRRKVELPEARRVFRLKPNAKLWVVATMNTSVYGGVYALNEDLKSRFRMIPLGYPDEKSERKILTKTRPESDPDLVNQMLTLAKESRTGNVSYAFSTRDLEQILEDTELAGLENALWMASGKFEESDRTWFFKRVASVFGVKVKNAASRS
jgi:nitric oxide reductase NorQ protein